MPEAAQPLGNHPAPKPREPAAEAARAPAPARSASGALFDSGLGMGLGAASPIGVIEHLARTPVEDRRAAIEDLSERVGNRRLSRIIAQTIAQAPAARSGRPTLMRFDTPGHRHATTTGLVGAGFSDVDIGRIYAANWERDFSQAHPALAAIVIRWKELKATHQRGEPTGPAVAAFDQAVDKVKGLAADMGLSKVLGLTPEATKAAYGGNPFYTHMDNPVGDDLDPAKAQKRSEKLRRESIAAELLAKTPEGIPRYMADSRDYIINHLVRGAEEIKGRFSDVGAAGQAKAAWDEREARLNKQVPPPKLAGAKSPATGSENDQGKGAIAEEATEAAKKARAAAGAHEGTSRLSNEAVQAFGRATHALEDFFAHSNFVDIAIGYDPGGKPDPKTGKVELQTGSFGEAEQKHSISHKIHAVVSQMEGEAAQLARAALTRRDPFGAEALKQEAVVRFTTPEGLKKLREMASKMEHETHEQSGLGSHTRLAKDQPAWPGANAPANATARDRLKTLRYELARDCATQANKVVFGALRNVIEAQSAQQAEAEMKTVIDIVKKLIAPPSPDHAVWSVIEARKREAAELIAQLKADDALVDSMVQQAANREDPRTRPAPAHTH